MLVKLYKEEEVVEILRASHGRKLHGNKAGGHADEKHELIGEGPGTPHAWLASMRARIQGGYPLKKGDNPAKVVSSFQNGLAKAVAFALNTDTGQNALRYVAEPATRSVVTRIKIAAGGFRVLTYSAARLTPNPSGAGFAPEPGSGLSFPRPDISIAEVLFMKLMSAPDGSLHIQTAFATDPAETTPWIQIEKKKAVDQTQTLPA